MEECFELCSSYSKKSVYIVYKVQFLSFIYHYLETL